MSRWGGAGAEEGVGDHTRRQTWVNGVTLFWGTRGKG